MERQRAAQRAALCSSDERGGNIAAPCHPFAPFDPFDPLDPRGGQGTGGVRGSNFADHNPLLKSVKSMCPFHGIAFITNEAFVV